MKEVLETKKVPNAVALIHIPLLGITMDDSVVLEYDTTIGYKIYLAEHPDVFLCMGKTFDIYDNLIVMPNGR